MAVHLKDLIKAQQQQQAAKNATQERMSVADLRKLMGLTSENTKKTTEVLGKIETLSVQSNSAQQEQVEDTKVLLEKDDGTHTRLDDIKSTLDKTLLESKSQTKTLEKIDKASETPKQTAEQIVEGERERAEQTKLLKTIADKIGDDKGKDEKKKDQKDIGLGGLGIAIAAAIGGVIAALRAQIKTIQLFARALLPESLLNALRKKTASFLAGLSMAYDRAAAVVAENFNTVRKFMSNVIGHIKQFFMGEGAFVTTLRKIFEVGKKVFGTLAEPFIELFKYIKKLAGLTNIFAPITEAISGAVSYASKFGKYIGVFSKIFTKLFYPIGVILTIWDTVKGAIAGWEKGGLVGAISGALGGLLSSLFGGLLDLVKSAVSWILGAFGFDKAEKFLDSFSFEDLIKGFFDALFAPLQLIQDLIMHPIDTIKKMGDQISAMLEGIGIPEISFTIPIIDKKVSIGPFYPFKKEGGSKGAAAPAAEQTSAKKQDASAAKPEGKAAELGNKPALTEAGKAQAAQAQTATNEGRAPSDTRVAKTAERDKTSVMVTVAGEPVQEGKPLSEKQVAIVESQMRLGNQPAPEVMNAYKLAKQQSVSAEGAKGDTASASAPTPTEASAVYNKSADNAQTAVNNQGAASAPVVVNAPVTTNVKNDQNISMAAPIRNTDRGFNRYMQKNSVFI